MINAQKASVRCPHVNLNTFKESLYIIQVQLDPLISIDEFECGGRRGTIQDISILQEKIGDKCPIW